MSDSSFGGVIIAAMAVGGTSGAAPGPSLSRSDKVLFYRVRRLRRRDAEHEQPALPISAVAVMERSRAGELSARCDALEVCVSSLLERVRTLETTPVLPFIPGGDACAQVEVTTTAPARTDGPAEVPSLERRSSAASTLQCWWRARRAQRMRVGNVVRVQAAWRGFRGRQTYILLASSREAFDGRLPLFGSSLLQVSARRVDQKLA